MSELEELRAAVERVARAIFMTDYGHMGPEAWETARLDGNSERPEAFVKARAAIAALGEAPEPEWEYRAKVVHPDWNGEHYIVFKHAPTREELENPVLYSDDFGGVNQLEGGKLVDLEYRRPASPWFPVEGQEKP